MADLFENYILDHNFWSRASYKLQYYAEFSLIFNFESFSIFLRDKQLLFPNNL